MLYPVQNFSFGHTRNSTLNIFFGDALSISAKHLSGIKYFLSAESLDFGIKDSELSTSAKNSGKMASRKQRTVNNVT